MIDAGRVFGDRGNLSGLVGFQKNAKHSTQRAICIGNPNDRPTWQFNLNDSRSENDQ